MIILWGIGQASLDPAECVGKSHNAPLLKGII